MTSKPLVSILIPVYNAEKWIAETLESALMQSWQNIEIIVVDDGSTDNSLEIIYQIKDPRIKVFHQENKGGSAARNVAFSKSSGDFIQYLDADDLLDIYKIERQVSAVGTNRSDLITGPYNIFYKNVDSAHFQQELAYRSYADTFDWVIENFQQKTMFSPNCWLIPRGLIIKTGPWDERLTYNDDSEFFTRLALNARKIIHVPDAISYYRKENGQSVSAQKDKKALQSRLLCLDLNTEHILNKQNNSVVRKIIANEYSKFIFSVFPFYKELIKEAQNKIVHLGMEPKRNFYKKNNISGILSGIVGWKSVKYLKYYLNRLRDL